jgi:hypothetical protein
LAGGIFREVERNKMQIKQIMVANIAGGQAEVLCPANADQASVRAWAMERGGNAWLTSFEAKGKRKIKVSGQAVFEFGGTL